MASSPPTEKGITVERKGGTEVAVLPDEMKHPLAAPVMAELQAVTHLEDLVRFQVGVRLHPLHQYEISGPREKYLDDEGREKWRETKTVTPSGDGYDYLNRVAGVDLLVPEFVHDQDGQRQPNPIHRRDYVYLRMVGIWRNDVGQLTTYREDVEVDFQRLYDEARMNASWNDDAVWVEKDGGAVHRERPRGSRDEVERLFEYRKGAKHKAADTIEWKRDEETGRPILDADGMPTFKLVLPADVELKAAQRLFDLRKFGLRYAYTVAKTRILKVALGVRKLPISQKGSVLISVAGWRDLLRPEERAAQAQKTSAGVWGAPIGEDAKPLTDEELQEHIGEEVIEGEFRAVDEVDDGLPKMKDPEPIAGDNQTLGLDE